MLPYGAVAPQECRAEAFATLDPRLSVTSAEPSITVGLLLRFSSHEYFAASFFTVVRFRKVAGRPSVFSRRAPENSESLKLVRHNQ